MPTYLKEVVRPGVYAIGERKIRITPDRVQRWARKFHEMKATGLRVPVPWEHPATYDESGKPKDDRDSRRLRNKMNAGWVEDMFVTESGALYAAMDIPLDKDAARVGTTVHAVSPEFGGVWRDGSGNVWKDTITHVALTPNPVQVQQDSFVRMSLDGQEDVQVPIEVHGRYSRRKAARALADAGMLKPADQMGMCSTLRKVGRKMSKWETGMNTVPGTNPSPGSPEHREAVRYGKKNGLSRYVRTIPAAARKARRLAAKLRRRQMSAAAPGMGRRLMRKLMVGAKWLGRGMARDAAGIVSRYSAGRSSIAKAKLPPKPASKPSRFQYIANSSRASAKRASSMPRKQAYLESMRERAGYRSGYSKSKGNAESVAKQQKFENPNWQKGRKFKVTYGKDRTKGEMTTKELASYRVKGTRAYENSKSPKGPLSIHYTSAAKKKRLFQELAAKGAFGRFDSAADGKRREKLRAISDKLGAKAKAAAPAAAPVAEKTYAKYGGRTKEQIRDLARSTVPMRSRPESGYETTKTADNQSLIRKMASPGTRKGKASAWSIVGKGSAADRNMPVSEKIRLAREQGAYGSKPKVEPKVSSPPPEEDKKAVAKELAKPGVKTKKPSVSILRAAMDSQIPKAKGRRKR